MNLGLARAASFPEAGRTTGSSAIPLDQLPAAVWTTDLDLILTASFGTLVDNLGMGPKQLVGTALSDLFETDDYDDELIQAHRRALDGESVCFEIRWVDRSYRARVAPLRSALGQVIGTICVALDETDATTTASGRDPRGAVASAR